MRAGYVSTYLNLHARSQRIPGLFARLSTDGYAVEALSGPDDMDPEVFRLGVAELEAAGWLERHGEVLWVPSLWRRPANPSVAKSWAAWLEARAHLSRAFERALEALWRDVLDRPLLSFRALQDRARVALDRIRGIFRAAPALEDSHRFPHPNPDAKIPAQAQHRAATSEIPASTDHPDVSETPKIADPTPAGTPCALRAHPPALRMCDLGSLRDLSRDRPTSHRSQIARATELAGEVLRAWNRLRGPLPEAKGLSPDLVERYAGDSSERWSVDHYIRVFERAARTPWLRGGPKGKRTGPATLVWLLLEGPDGVPHAKALLDGRYDPLARRATEAARQAVGRIGGVRGPRPSPVDGELAARARASRPERPSEPARFDREALVALMAEEARAMRAQVEASRLASRLGTA